jgi:hypothetical protein
MKAKIVFFLGFSVSLCVFAYCQDGTFTEGYKNATWGMAPDAVKKAFSDTKFFDEQGAIYFLTNLGEDKATIGFKFVQERLYWVGILFDVETTNKQRYLEKFNDYENLLKKKYGAPKQSVRNVDDEYMPDEATALSMGKGVYYDLWETTESQILLSLNGDNFDLTLRITYESIMLGKEGAKIKEQKTLENL